MKNKRLVLLAVFLFIMGACYWLWNYFETRAGEDPNEERTFSSTNISFSYDIPEGWEVMNEEEGSYFGAVVPEGQVMLLLRSRQYQESAGEEYVYSAFSFFNYGNMDANEWYESRREENIGQFGQPVQEETNGSYKKLTFSQNRLNGMNEPVGEETIVLVYYFLSDAILQNTLRGEVSVFEKEVEKSSLLINSVSVL